MAWLGAENQATAALAASLGRVAFALLLILIAENFYRNADESARWHVNLPCIVAGGIAALDVLVYAEASLSQSASRSALDARAVATALTMPLLVLAAMRMRRFSRRPRVSHKAAFHGTTLLVSGTFLLAVGVAGEALRRTGAEWGDAARVSLIAGSLIALLVVLTAGSARSRIRRLVADHFLSARFDYREEWLRTLRSLSDESGLRSEGIRAIRAIADAVDSPGGVLLRSSPQEGELRWAESWNAPVLELSSSDRAALLAGFREGSWVQVLRDAEEPVPKSVSEY
ncbi:MAG TPA: PEP-CTERM system histidine kinase PrsK, partial [Acetobacteraceae bacterium]|nr:PEP-CTERM system histidine kinase PrsK [Acetobacteraceae bacterium]